jgi:hypothetical protein
VGWQTCTKILTKPAAGMDSMIHKNAGTCLPGFTVSHRTRLYLALTTMRTSDVTNAFTEVKYQRLTGDYVVAVLQFLKSKLWLNTVEIQYKLKHTFKLCSVQMGGKSKIWMF